MKRIVLCFLIVLVACERKSEIQKLDSMVDALILAEINQFNPNLWDQIESRFYHSIGEPLWIEKNKFALLHNFMYSHHINGYPDSFEMNDLDSNLIYELDKIGLTGNDEAGHVFIHSVIAKNVNAFRFSGNMREESPMIFSYAMVDPDSISLSFTLMDFSLYNEISVKEIERDGTYKLTVLFYFSELLNRKN